MWRASNKHLWIILLFVLLLARQGSAQELVHDLQQDWLRFDSEHSGFVPVESQNLDETTISFELNAKLNKGFYLVIGTAHETALFYKGNLLAILDNGYSSFKIDSLANELGAEHLFLSLHSDNLLPDLTTTINIRPVNNDRFAPVTTSRFANDFANFVYSAAVIILFIFVLLRVRFGELMEQYLLFQRSYRFKTIDEPIYKIPYLRAPNLFFIILMSMMLAFATLLYMYMYPGDLRMLHVNPATEGFWLIQLYWLGISMVLFVAFVAKYLLTVMMSSVFSLEIRNIHFASSLRLIFPVAILLAITSLVHFIYPMVINQSFYWLLLIGGVIVMEVILYFKLTLASSHTHLYIIVYLCATELIPVTFLCKLYAA